MRKEEKVKKVERKAKGMARATEKARAMGWAVAGESPAIFFETDPATLVNHAASNIPECACSKMPVVSVCLCRNHADFTAQSAPKPIFACC